MAINLKGRSFLTLEDFTPAEIRYLLDLGHDLKAKRRAGVCDPTLQGKHIVLLFEKTSTRTRCSFEVAATQEGGHVTYLDAGSSQMGKKESLEDSAKVLGRFFDGIEYRGYDQKVVEDLAKFAGVPVWNGLTDADHPTQILADMMTIEEHCSKPLNKVKVVFPGDVRNNMCYAWMLGAAKMGMHFVGLGPKELAKEMEQIGVKTIIFTDISRDGTLTGPNLEQLVEINNAVSCDITASGGVTNINDIRKLKNKNLYGAICGKSIYEGTLDLKQAVEACND